MKKSLTALFGAAMVISSLGQNVRILPQTTDRWIGLAWTRSPSTNVTGYKIYYGPTERTYTNNVNVGNVDTTLVTNLVDNSTYHFSATAHDINGLESDFSNEAVAYTGPSSSCYSTNISGKWYYVLKQTRFTNDNIFRYMQSTNGTTGWERNVNATKLSETNLINGSYLTTWLVSAPTNLPVNMYFESDWLLSLNSTNKPASTSLTLQLK